tara:strand:- start:116 stop:1771 length:1656 start_codon:yes stop_codon:yes gene_type:complete
MTKARDIADFKFEDIVDTGTEGTKVASGTTAQRGSTTGQWRYNTTTGFFEGRGASAFTTLEPTPTISSVDTSLIDSDASGNATIVITGNNFSSGGTVTFVGSSANFNASTTTFNSSTQVTAVAPISSFLNAQEPYKIKFTSANGVAGTSSTGLINVDVAPTWSTASGQIAEIFDNATGTHATVSATDSDGDTVAYSETGGTVLSSQNLTLNSSTGAISGDPTDVAANTTLSFNLRATAGSKTADRAFTILLKTLNPNGGDFGANYSYGGTNYRVLKFTSSGNLIVPVTKSVDYLLIGGGGAGGHHSGGGGGAGGLVWKTSQSLSAGTYAFSMGAGGITNTQNQIGGDGGSSTFNGHTANGGGGGAGHLSNGANSGRSGGSGGGGQRGQSAGSATQPGSSTGGYGNAGASSGSTNGDPNYAAYAGGGAGSAGSNRTGGDGHASFVGDTASTTAFLLAALAGTDSSNVATTGSSSGTLYIAGGGGGSDQSSSVTATYPGGKGGGGLGTSHNTKDQVENGLANTGSGSGGQSYGGGTVYTRNGGSGVLIVRFTI